MTMILLADDQPVPVELYLLEVLRCLPMVLFDIVSLT